MPAPCPPGVSSPRPSSLILYRWTAHRTPHYGCGIPTTLDFPLTCPPQPEELCRNLRQLDRFRWRTHVAFRFHHLKEPIVRGEDSDLLGRVPSRHGNDRTGVVPKDKVTQIGSFICRSKGRGHAHRVIKTSAIQTDALSALRHTPSIRSLVRPQTRPNRWRSILIHDHSIKDTCSAQDHPRGHIPGQSLKEMNQVHGKQA